jgi:hypothetical protein
VGKCALKHPNLAGVAVRGGLRRAQRGRGRPSAGMPLPAGSRRALRVSPWRRRWGSILVALLAEPNIAAPVQQRKLMRARNERMMPASTQLRMDVREECPRNTDGGP